jgi:superfamily I DNA and/or RNA helicase
MEVRFRDGARDSKAPQKLETMLRRFAKITPCMVTNFHMAPAIFMGWLGQPQPLWNAIDLLIVDEAGQVAPEVGAPTFALAKRAVVVGDVYQIEPIWNVPESIDRANAAKFGLIKKWDDPRYVKMEQDGYTAARGNLMHMSARACRLRKYPDLRGLLLTEHRRCVPELIAYCNQLVYGGRLEPKRAAIPPDQRILPPFGYFPAPGKDRKVGGSRNNHGEAQAIVDWIVRHRAALEHHYRHPTTGQALHISQIIGIVTPFAPQAGLIASMLRKALPDTRQKGRTITVGTVHRLQGAEREIVLFSPVYGDDHKGGMFFDNGPNMLNVAVSRARDSFLVFGNLALFNPQKSGSPSGVLAQYLFKYPENNLGSAQRVALNQPATQEENSRRK